MDAPLDAEFITAALLKAAGIGSRICLEQRHQASISFKPIGTSYSPVVALASSIVTDADLAVQEAILRYLLDCGLQDCTIQAEEDTASLQKFQAKEGSPAIFIDPIDGTLTYALGCPNFESLAAAAGFQERLLQQTKDKVDRRLYGSVLGALILDSAPVSVCALPELQITFHSRDGAAFRNGAPLNHQFRDRPVRVAIGRRLLDPSGEASTPFASAGVNVHWFAGSAPAILWHIFEGACTGFAERACDFDVQLAAMVARASGLLVCDRYGRDIAFDLYRKIDCVVIASSLQERDRICKVLQSFP